MATDLPHPWALLAIADLAALHTAWEHLTAARVRVARTAIEEAAPVQAWRPKIQVSGGGGPSTVDSITSTAAAAELDYLHRLEAEASNAVDQARWIALEAFGEVPGSWDTTTAAIGCLDGPHARAALAWITPVNARIRKALHLGDDQALIPGNPECPYCTVRLMRTRTASGLVQCTADCRCLGDPCGCRMPVRDRGAPHLWERTP